MESGFSQEKNPFRNNRHLDLFGRHQVILCACIIKQDEPSQRSYREEDVYVVGNSVVDAIETKRAEKPSRSIFEIYLNLESGERMRVDIHKRENLTKSRFSSIIGGVTELVKAGQKVVSIKLTATQKVLEAYDLADHLTRLEEDYPQNFLQTPL